MIKTYSDKNYRLNQQEQLDKWLAGNPVHNPLVWGDEAVTVDGGLGGECCPDFSCCTGNIQSLKFRQAFVNGTDRERQTLMFAGLGAVIADIPLMGDDKTAPMAYLAGENYNDTKH